MKSAQTCVLWGTHLHESDVVFVDASYDPVLIKACTDTGRGLALLVAPLLYATDVNRAATLNHDSGRTEILRSSDCSGVVLCRAWSINGDGSYVVVRAGSVYWLYIAICMVRQNNEPKNEGTIYRAAQPLHSGMAATQAAWPLYTQRHGRYTQRRCGA